MLNQLMEVQKLNIELFFNNELSSNFNIDPNSILKKRKINPKYLKYFPQTQSESFKVESFGRRTLITREIAKRFNVFFKKYFESDEIVLNDLINTDILINYFKSDYFLFNKVNFPHYTGAGNDLENCSKFFFFAINYLKNKPHSNESLVELYSAFAIHIHHHAQFSDVEIYRTAKNGMTFELDHQLYFIFKNIRIKADQLKISFLQSLPSLNDLISKFSIKESHESI